MSEDGLQSYPKIITQSLGDLRALPKRHAVVAVLLLSFAFSIATFIIPAPEGFSMQAWHLLGVLAPVVAAWAFSAIPIGVAALILLIAIALFGIASPAMAFGGFINHLPWLMFSAFILTQAMASSGLSKRMALWLLSKARNLPSLLLGAFLANVLMAPVPSATGRCSILAPILDAIMDSLGRPSKSNLACYVTYAFLMACTSWTGIMLLTSGAANGATLAFYEQLTGSSLSFLQWFALMLLPAAFLSLCALGAARLVSGPMEPELLQRIGSVDEARHQYLAMGPMDAPQKKVLICFILMVLLWVFGDLIGLSAGYAALLVAIPMLLPQLGILQPLRALREVNWDIVLLVASLIGFAAVVNATGLADSLTVLLFNPLMNPIYQRFGLLGICLNVLIISCLAHFLLPTPNNIVLAAPVLISWGMGAGLEPALLLALLVLPIAMHDRIVPFAYQMPPYFVILGLDVVAGKRFSSLLLKTYPLLALCVIPASFICLGVLRLLGI